MYVVVERFVSWTVEVRLWTFALGDRRGTVFCLSLYGTLLGR